MNVGGSPVHFERRLKVYKAFWSHSESAVRDLARALNDVLVKGGRIFVGGNGGSAAQADHFVAELVGRFQHRRNALPAHLLGGGLATLTALSNDFGYENALKYELDALAKPGDALLVLTTSGRSSNVREVLHLARERGMFRAVLTGELGKDLEADMVVVVPSQETPLIQEVHLQILHTLAAWLEGEQ